MFEDEDHHVHKVVHQQVHDSHANVSIERDALRTILNNTQDDHHQREAELVHENAALRATIEDRNETILFLRAALSDSEKKLHHAQDDSQQHQYESARANHLRAQAHGTDAPLSLSLCVL